MIGSTIIPDATLVDMVLRITGLRDRTAEIAAALEQMENNLRVRLQELSPEDLDEEGRVIPPQPD